MTRNAKVKGSNAAAANSCCLEMMSVTYAECHYAECLCAECHYVECLYAECLYADRHYAECRGAKK